ncbi:MAG: DUF5806 family protein [Methanoregula sp.]|jgi:hypothetical protein
MDESTIQQEINKYKKFKKVDGATYRKVNFFLRKRTYITAREWALARLCTDFRTANGAEMTFIGKHLPELVPFMEEPYTPQAVNQARHSFKKKVRKSGATFFYGAMCGFFSTDELDDLLFEASEVSRFLLEVEGTTIDIDDEIDIEDRISNVMRSVGETAKTILKTRSSDTDVVTPTESTAATPSTPVVHRTSRKKNGTPVQVQAAPEVNQLTGIPATPGIPIPVNMTVNTIPPTAPDLTPPDDPEPAHTTTPTDPLPDTKHLPEQEPAGSPTGTQETPP